MRTVAAHSSGLVGRPTARPPVGYRFFRSLFRLLSTILVRVHVEGLENLPRDEHGRPIGGWICAAMPHRTWIEPFVLVGMLPARPRLTMMADAPTAVGSWWRRLLVGWVGGVVLVPRRARGSRSFETHAEAARRILKAGAVFSLFPEVGRPARPPALRRLSPAVAYFALRTGAPIVTVVFGGTHELFLRRRIHVRVLTALQPPAAPPPDSTAERAAADALVAALLDRVGPVAAELHAAAEAEAPRRRWWRWLTGPFPQAD